MTWLPTWKHRALGALPMGLAIIFCFIPVIEQPDWYHRFVDTRALAGIPNFGDVASNIAFLLVGLYGVRMVMAHRPKVAANSWMTMFVGVILVSAGSTYYHLAPANGPLVWDRLPMTIAFTAMTVAVLTEFVSARIERVALVPIVALGAMSVIVWHLTGDLRFYFWVQATSVGIVLLSIFAFRIENGHTRYIFAAGILYGLAVLSEQFDREIFEALSFVISGHTLKHFLAAAGLLMFALRLGKLSPSS